MTVFRVFIALALTWFCKIEGNYCGNSPPCCFPPCESSNLGYSLTPSNFPPTSYFPSGSSSSQCFQPPQCERPCYVPSSNKLISIPSRPQPYMPPSLLTLAYPSSNQDSCYPPPLYSSSTCRQQLCSSSSPTICPNSPSCRPRVCSCRSSFCSCCKKSPCCCS